MRPAVHCPSSSRGFSLLEAVVAMAILAAVGMALFAAIGQTVQNVSRAEQARQVDTAFLNALAFLESVNPAERPDGEEPLGDFTLKWRAVPMEEPLPDVRRLDQIGAFRIGLYRVELQLWQSGRQVGVLVVRRVGHASNPGRKQS